jgi:hypothetical protein
MRRELAQACTRSAAEFAFRRPTGGRALNLIRSLKCCGAARIELKQEFSRLPDANRNGAVAATALSSRSLRLALYSIYGIIH